MKTNSRKKKAQNTTLKNQFKSVDEYDKIVQKIPSFLKIFWSSKDYRNHRERLLGGKNRDERKRLPAPAKDPIGTVKELLFGTSKSRPAQTEKGKIAEFQKIRKKKHLHKSKDNSFSR